MTCVEYHRFLTHGIELLQELGIVGVAAAGEHDPFLCIYLYVAIVLAAHNGANDLIIVFEELDEWCVEPECDAIVFSLLLQIGEIVFVVGNDELGMHIGAVVITVTPFPQIGFCDVGDAEFR